MSDTISQTGLEIAVIGMAGRFPGARNIHQFWENLKNGIEAVSFFSDQELEEAGTGPDIINNPAYVKAKGVLEGAEYFDASFFGYTPAEAKVMDPQVRLFHQCSWEALEDAGYYPESYRGKIGIYAGATANFNWQTLSVLSGAAGALDAFSASQLLDKDYLTMRISFKLNLRGPSFAVQTACSTSLVAIHLATQGLLSGECSMALAGGVTVTIPQKNGYMYQEGMVVSPDGHCRAFDAGANGFVDGNGAGVVVLKLLENAAADGDFIHAVIRGSAINNDGNQKSGFTAPSIKAQREVIKGALSVAEVEPESIGYVETHGTGTPLGDPIEIESLKRAFNTNKKRFCRIGSVKTNVGHLDSAAGVAGFIKTVLMLKHRQIPPSLHFNTPNPEIDFENTPFVVNTRLKQWENGKYPLRAGVSSFGIGGSNAHVVLEDWNPAPEARKEENRDYQLIPISARTRPALDQMTENLLDCLKRNPAQTLADVAYTLQVGRKPLNHRRMVVCTSVDEVAAGLSDPSKLPYHLVVGDKRRVVFMFAGLGSQYIDMGLELYLEEPLFREEMDRCFDIVNTLLDYDIKDILYPPAARSPQHATDPEAISRIDISQVVVFIVEYALAKLLMKFGIKPHSMIGYSFGEYTAACLAGVFSLEHALKIIVCRGKLLREIPGGAMFSVPLPASEAAPLLTDELAIAIDNGSSCIIAGPGEAVAAFGQQIKQKKLMGMPVPHSVAMHSKMMDPILATFEKELGNIPLNQPQIPYISNLTGKWIDAGEVVKPTYWCKHLRETVRFSEGITELVKKPNSIFIEIGPGRDLSTMVKRFIDPKAGQKVLNLVRPPQKHGSDVYYLLNKIGYLWLYGVNIDWSASYSRQRRCRIPLPTYPFEKQRYWIDTKFYRLMQEIASGKTLVPVDIESAAAEDTGGVPGISPVTAAKESDTPVFQRSELSTTYIAPGSGVEKAIVDIWQRFFGITPIGIRDDFFELGGDSLKAMNVSAIVQKELSVEIPVAEFFDRQTIQGLADYIEGNVEKRHAFSIDPVEKREYYPVTSAQKRLYVLQHMEEGNTGYNQATAVVLEGKLGKKKLTDTYKQLIKRHESFRTSFEMIDGEIVQQVHEEVEFDIEYFGVETQFSHFVRPFVLSRPPLARVGLKEEGKDRYILMVDMHHIVSDGISLALLIKEFMSFYSGETLPRLRFQYKDFSVWQNSEEVRESMMRQETYWLREFAGEIPVLELPTDFPRPVLQSFLGATVEFELDKACTGALRRFALDRGTTLFMVLLTVYNIFLHKISSQEDIVVGTPVAGRPHADLAPIVGMFVNTLALRNFPEAGKTVDQFLEEIKTRALDAFAYQDYQYEDLVDKTAVARDTGRNPLFDTMFSLLNIGLQKMEIPGLNLEPYVHDQGTARFDLTLQVIEMDETLAVSFEYCTKLFKASTIERFIYYFKKIVSAVPRESAAKIADIDIMSREERDQLLYDFNATDTDYPEEKTIYQSVEEQVNKTPDTAALVSGAQQLSYSALNHRANRLARLLREKGVKPSIRVAIMVKRSVEMVIGLMGILKSGGAYVPVDPEYPGSRITAMLEQSGASIVLTSERLMESKALPALAQVPGVQAVPIDLPGGDMEKQPVGNLSPLSGPRDLIYIIFTSGSTGKPKGAGVYHRGFMNLMHWFVTEFGLDSRDRNLLLTSLSFDLTQKNFYAPLITGGTLCIPALNYFEPRALLRQIHEQRITWFNCTPSMSYEMVKNELQGQEKRMFSLRYVFLGGEPISMTTLLPWLESEGCGAEIVNTYGPTECTDICASYRIKEPRRFLAETIPVGRPVYNVQLYVPDKNLQLLPVGVPGELLIGGDGVGIGYVNDKALTAQKFITHSFVPDQPGQLLYRTGDLVKWLADGSIEFLGRIDHQVKIRGYRIELGEIETWLLKHQSVREAVVLVKGEESGDKYICAYFVPGETFSIDQIKKYLSKNLPDYMIPSYFVSLDRIPLSPNGKVDRKALPEPEAQMGTDMYTAPRNMTEIQLVEAWSEVLGIESKKISIDANFFAIGGHSLKATVMAAKVHKELKVDLPLAEIFKTPTIRGLAECIAGLSEYEHVSIAPAEKREYYPLSSAQRRLYFVQGMDNQGISYNLPDVVTLEGELDRDRFETTFKRLIRRHESLRTSFREVKDEPVQSIHEHVDFKIEYLAGGEIEPIIRGFVRAFDLSHAPLIRVGLIKMAGDRHLLLVDVHHIVSDGVSSGLLVREFMTLYSGEMLPEPAVGITYKDYALWQHSPGTRESMAQQETYWLSQFAGEIPVLHLPYDFARPKVRSFEGSVLGFEIGKEETAALKTYALEEGTTLFTVLLAVSNVFLSKLSGQQDIVVGSPIAGRRHSDLQHIVGMFVNTLLFRHFPVGEKTFTGFMAEVKKQTLDAFSNQDYLYEELVENVDVARDTGRNPLFDVVFMLQNMEVPGIEIPGLKLKPYQFQQGTSKFDLTLAGFEGENRLSFNVEYSTKLFKTGTIEQFITYFKNVLAVVSENPGIKIADIEIISPEQKKEVLYDFNDTVREYPAAKTIQQLFEEQAAKTPHLVGAQFIAPGTGTLSMTYEQLDKISHGLARLLRERGVEPGAVVGIMAEPSVEMIIGLLAILKRGGAYLPVNPDYPAERKRYLLKDGNVNLLLTNRHQDIPPGCCREMIYLEDTVTYGSEKGESGGRAGDLVYIIYTSGSTGGPKGVMVEHRSVVRLVKNTNYVQFDRGSRILQTGALEFDASTFEIWGALLNGLELYLAPRDTLLAPAKLKGIIRSRGITTIWMTAPLFNQMVDADIGIFQGLHHLLVGGDALSPPHINRVRNSYPGLQVINGYGPTENTTFSTTFPIEKDYSSAIPIGSPIANSTAYIVDKYNHVVPIGVQGELWVGGDGVSRGYLNNPELTVEKFNRSYRSYRSYKTGDLARWLPGGNIEFLGRIDFQVKIRGFRIELGEIENRLSEHTDIRETTVLVKENETGEKYLCAYFVAEKELPVTDLRQYLSKNLPDYMIPSYFMPLEKIPLTSNGKVDRKALPAPEVKTGDAYTAPANEIEAALVNIWAELLEFETGVVGVNDNFFELGGHSLKATVMAGKVHKQLNVDLPLVEIFTNPTITELAAYIKELSEDKYVSIEPAEKREYYPLSSAQRRLYFVQGMDKLGITYNIPAFVVLEGDLDKNKLENTFKRLIQRHESLRTSFLAAAEEAVQRIHEQAAFKLEYQNITGSGVEVKEIIDRFVRPFDLSQAPLMRAGLVKLPGDGTISHVLMVDMHHIVSDGVSLGLLIREFMSFYSGAELPGPGIHYKDFTLWQVSRGVRESMKQQEEYWQKEFGDEAPVLHLPYDFARPVVQRFDGSTLNFQIDKETTGALKAYALEQGTTLFTLLLAIYNVFLFKLSSQEDIVVGTPIAGRRHADLEPIVGMFVNTLALRNFPGGEQTFGQFLGDVKTRTLDAFSNQDYLFEDLVETVTIARDPGRNPLFDVMFMLQNMDIPAIDIPGLKLRPYDYEEVTSKFDLTLRCMEGEEALHCTLVYSTKLFKALTIKTFIHYFKTIVSTVLAAPAIKMSEIDILSEQEKRILLLDFNDTDAEYPREQTIHGLFAEQAAKTPERTAVIGPQPNNGSLTYRELNTKVDQLAALLVSKGMGPGTVVTLMLEPSPEMIAAILAVLRAGSCYLPLDPRNPESRITYILKDSETRLIMTQGDLVERFEPGIETLAVENQDLYRTEVPLPAKTSGPADPVYMIYTSGTTGQPKGVLVKHENLVNYVTWFSGEAALTEEDKTPLTSSFAFDLGYTSIYPSLLSGAQLHILSKDTYMQPGRLLDYIHDHGISYLKVTPSLFSTVAAHPSFSAETCKTLRLVVLGGEAINVADVETIHRVCPHIKVMNHYGPTEVTIGCIARFIDFQSLDAYKSRPTIGKPIANIKAYILDRYFGLLPLGVAGELCLSGAGVARGYFKQEALTSERFIANTMIPASQSGALHDRVYRTGDLARWLPQGDIEFLGRIDHQIKIRGFRVELGEIENQLLSHQEIKEAVVVVKTGENNDKYLCAYIVSDRELTAAEGVEFLSAKLPDYMIPAYFVPLQQIPLTPNGKVDRRALPEPESGSDVQNYIAPRDAVEETFVKIWAAVLALEKEKISIDSDFFRLGGHSLKATVLAANVHKEFNIDLPMAEIFKTPTVKGLSQYVKEGLNRDKYVAVEPVEKREYYPLSSAQRRLYLVQAMVQGGITYNLPAPALLEGDLDKDRLEHTFKRLIQRHESLRTSFHRVKEEPVQRIHENAAFEIQELSGSDGMGNFVRPFDLSQAPLLRVGVKKENEKEHLLMVDMHHIISDGVSRGVLIKEFMALYSGEALPELRLQYKDFSRWQNSDGVKEAMKQQEAYWLQQFEEDIPVLNLPNDFTRPRVQSFDGSRVSFDIDEKTAGALKTCAEKEGTTLFMVLLAAYNVFLSKLSSQEDIVVGTPIAGRRHSDLQDIVGMFVNTLALRNFPKGEETFDFFLADVKNRLLNAFSNQDYLYEDLVEKAVVTRDPGRNPLFDAAIALQNIDIPEIDEINIPGLKLKPYNDLQFEISKFDLTLWCLEVGELLQFSFEYCTKLFTPVTIERFVDYFRKLISIIAENPGIEIKNIEITPEEEKQKILYDFNDTGKTLPLEKTLHRLFEEQVQKTPANIVIAAESLQGKRSRVHHLTYQELDKKSGLVAHLLIKKGVKENNLVGLLADRSIEMIVGMLGILKAGGAYVPLNPKAPASRNEYILEECRAGILVSATDKVGRDRGAVPIRGLNKDIETINLNETLFTYSTYPTHPTHLTHPAHLCYVIFTSGSTGNPKGVPITHGNLFPLLHWGYRLLGLGPRDRVIQNLSYYFDWSVWEIFITLTSGAGLTIVPEDVLLNPPLCAAFMDKQDITALHVTPSQYQYLVQTGLPLMTLNYLLIGAEKLSLDLVRRSFRMVKQGCRVFNMYGPTECTIITSTLEMYADDLDKYEPLASVPIGPPAANAKYFILDKYLKPCPLMVAGELYIAGDGAARGYLNNPELTAEKFPLAGGPSKDGLEAYAPTHPTHPLTHSPFYKTGDLARWLPDGTVEFLGRIDHQVKVRGYRIELGEIESWILKHKSVREVVVLVRGEETGDKYICAYLIPGQEFSINALKQYLSKNLPDYMVPSHFVPIEKIPLNPNGKIDTKALPLPVLTAEEETAAPRDDIEVKLVDIWAEVLEIEKNTIGINSDFFQLGGHSLKATVLAARVQKELEVDLTLVDVFTAPTIREMAQWISAAGKIFYAPIPGVEEKDTYDLSRAQERMWTMCQLESASAAFNIPMVQLLEGKLDIPTLERVFAALVERHESFRTVFVTINGQPKQKILAPGDIDFKVGHINLENETEVREWVEQESIIPFDLARGPLLRITVIGLAEEKYVFFLNMHHIIGDYVSFNVFIAEMLILYGAFLEGKPNPLEPLRIQYKDYAQWHNEQLRGDQLNRHREYWLSQLEGKLPQLELSRDKERPAVQTYNGDDLPFTFDEAFYIKLKTFSESNNVTLFMTLLTALNLLFYFYSGQTDILLGTVIAGREHADLRDQVGYYLNTLTLRTRFDARDTFTAVLGNVKTVLTDAYQHQVFPFDQLVEDLGIKRDRARHPIFDVMVDMLNYNADHEETLHRSGSGNIHIENFDLQVGTAHFDLSVLFTENKNTLDVNFEYNTDLFERATIERMVNRFKKLLETVLEKPGSVVSGLRLEKKVQAPMIQRISRGKN